MDKALEYHCLDGRPGKVSVVPTKPCSSAEDLSYAYTPGVAKPVLEIEKDAANAYRYTSKGNLVAVISNGTAILGLGDRGALASKPVMEGKGVLFKRFADIDVFDIEVNEKDPEKFVQIVRIGLPAGVSGAVFSISNVLIQSSVNSFGSITMAGNAAAQNIEGFIYTAMNSLYQASINFTSQNFGAGKSERIVRVLICCLGIVTAVGIILGVGAMLLGPELLHIYSSDPEVIHYGLIRLNIISITYFLCGMMDVGCGSIRGMGYSITPTIVSLLGAWSTDPCLCSMSPILSPGLLHSLPIWHASLSSSGGTSLESGRRTCSDAWMPQDMWIDSMCLFWI